MIIKGDFVRWDSGELLPTYGVVLSIVDNRAKVEYRNYEGEYKVIEKELDTLTKIGSK